VIRLLAAVLFSNAAYTAFMSALAWEALRLGDGPGGPARVFAVSSALSLCAAPLLGVLVDRWGPRRALATSQLLTSTVMGTAAVLRCLGWGQSLASLLVLAAFNSLASAMTTPAAHGLLQRHSTPDTATSLASRNGLAVSLGFVAGYSSGGLVLDAFGFAVALAACSTVSLGVATLAWNLRSDAREPPPRRPTRPGGAHEIFAGVRYVFGDAVLRETASAYVLCYAIFHTVTALLPPFSKFVLGVDAPEFGVLRAAWSLGAAAGALMLSLFWGKRRAARTTRFIAIAVLGLAFAAFGRARDFTVAATLIVGVGVIHAACRALLDGQLIDVCAPHLIGRVRGVVNSIISAVSLIIFVAASGVRVEWIGSIFMVVGVTVTAISGTFYLRGQRQGLPVPAGGAPPAESAP
jgi:MFS family permease